MTNTSMMRSILQAFSGFISQQPYFDILWSEKVGYVKILAECPEAEGALVLNTPEKILNVLYTGVAEAVVCDRHGPQYDPYEHGLDTTDQAECRCRVAAILEAAGDVQENCLGYLEHFLPMCFR